MNYFANVTFFQSMVKDRYNQSIHKTLRVKQKTNKLRQACSCSNMNEFEYGTSFWRCLIAHQ